MDRVHGRKRATRRLALAATVLALAAGTAACGDDGDEASTDTTAESEGSGADVTVLEITEFTYPDLTVSAGGTLEVRNDSSADHTVTADDGAFDEDVDDGDTVTVDMPSEPGEYPYHCEIHPDMAATITVE